MANLDVELLITNILLKETINNCVSYVHNKNLYNGKLNKSDLFKLLEAATSESSFVFDFLLYKKIGRVAMGSLLGSMLGDAFHCPIKKCYMFGTHVSKLDILSGTVSLSIICGKSFKLKLI